MQSRALFVDRVVFACRTSCAAATAAAAAAALAVLGAMIAGSFAGPLAAQNAPPYNLPHVSTRLGTDAFIFQALGGTKVNYTTRAEMFSGYALSPVFATYDVTAAPYSAKCDNATDDTTAIQSAINDAGAAGGGRVLIPPAKCVISRLTVTLPGVWITGQGIAVSTLRSNATTGDVIAFGNTAASYYGCGGLKDLQIGVSVTKTTGASITVDGCGIGVVDNVRLTTTNGGDGIHISPTGGLSGIWFFRNMSLELNGAFTGIRIEGSNDQYFSNLWLQGNSNSSSIGIDLRNTAGTWFTDVEAVQFGYGVLLEPGNSQSVTWCNFSNVLSDHSVLDGWRITQSGTGFVWGNTFNAIWAGTNTNNGVYVGTGIANTFIAPRIWSNGQNGIRIAVGATFTTISAGTIIQNSSSSSGTYDGIAVDASTNNFRISGSTVAGGGFTASQRYGISIAASADNYQITGNTVSGNVTGAILNTPGLATTRIVTNNPGASMESYATVTALASAGGWTDSGATVAQTTTTDKIGMGTATTPTEALSISLNTAQPVASALAGTTTLSLTPADAGQARLMLRGIGGPAPSIDGVCSGGTLASPSACVSGSVILQLSASGRDNSAFASSVNGAIQFIATETWSTTGHGERADLFVTGTGTTAVVDALRVTDAGHLGFPAAVGTPTVACTGTGTSPAAPTMATGSTDSSFSVIVNTGTSPANTGTCTVTFGKVYATYSFPVCMLTDGASAWSNEAVIRLSTKSLSAPVFSWTNEASGVLTALTGSSSYQFNCIVTGL